MSTKPSQPVAVSWLSTGVPGLDEILHGGLHPQRIYMVEGTPGCGKTTLGLQFLLAGVRRGENGLYLALSETREELAEVVASHGWDLDGISIVESAIPQGVQFQGILTGEPTFLGGAGPLMGQGA